MPAVLTAAKLLAKLTWGRNDDPIASTEQHEEAARQLDYLIGSTSRWRREDARLTQQVDGVSVLEAREKIRTKMRTAVAEGRASRRSKHQKALSDAAAKAEAEPTPKRRKVASARAAPAASANPHVAQADAILKAAVGLGEKKALARAAKQAAESNGLSSNRESLKILLRRLCKHSPDIGRQLVTELSRPTAASALPGGDRADERGAMGSLHPAPAPSAKEQQPTHTDGARGRRAEQPRDIRGPLRVGTDCSGIEAPIQAFENLDVEFKHVFSSDKDPHVQQMIRANFAGHHIYEDLTKRDHAQVPDCDVYVAGWPCQGNSSAGKRKGFADARSQVFHSVVAYIRCHQPRLVLLENVENLLKVNGGKDFHEVVGVLKGLGSYDVKWKLLNTKDHGVPQNRSRVYFVCIRNDADQGTFTWPEPLGATPGIDRFLDTREASPAWTNEFAPRLGSQASDTFDANMEALNDQDADPLKQPHLFQVNCSKAWSIVMRDTSPCLMTNCRIWISHYGRELNLAEKCRLQGMSPRRLNVVVSKTQFAKQLGNSMSVNVLERILAAALPAAGLSAPLRDRWASGYAVADLEATRNVGLVPRRNLKLAQCSL
jgi:DNA (cytosine-5)-methyltransferase 1